MKTPYPKSSLITGTGVIIYLEIRVHVKHEYNIFAFKFSITLPWCITCYLWHDIFQMLKTNQFLYASAPQGVSSGPRIVALQELDACAKFQVNWLSRGGE